MTKTDLTRRSVLAAGLAAGSAPLTPSSAEVIHGEMPWSEGVSRAPSRVGDGQAYVFFSAAEGAFVEAAVDRMIPRDNLGPGGLDAGAPRYIDRQLAGPFGNAERWYMLGPWGMGSDSQGYQARYTPAQLYRAAIKAVDVAVGQAHGGVAFAKLEGSVQDDWLNRLEKGDAKLNGVDGQTFFEMFLQNVMEGFFADPLYGGNRDMAGWKLIGFAGARYDRRDWVLKHNQPYPHPPVAIGGRDAWSRS